MSSSDEVTAAAADVVGCEKTRWPETVGLCAEEATKIILKNKPDADIIVLPAGTGTDHMFNHKRVHVFVDTVAEIPRVG